MSYARGSRTALAPFCAAARPQTPLRSRVFATVSQARFSSEHCFTPNSRFNPSKCTNSSLMFRKSSRACSNKAENKEETQPDTGQIKDNILSASLKHVKELGWSEQAIVQGVRDCGYSVSAHSMFSRGGGDLALYFYQSSNEKLSQLLKEQKENLAPDEKLDVGKFVKDAIKQRVRMTSEFNTNWPSAMAHLSSPSCAAESLTLLGELVDEIWHLAGDKSTDINWYTKRGLLAAIYKSSELFMLQDKSPDFEETDKFIDRRFEDTSSLTNVVSSLTSITPSDIANLTRSGYTVGMNILGLKHLIS